MTKPTFDPTRRLVMGQFKTVHGHSLQPGTGLVITDDPDAPGEVEQAMAKRLWLSGVAVYAEDRLPTPVETPEQEKARLAVVALKASEPAAPGEPAVITDPPSDLDVWAEDDEETGKRKGAKVTVPDLQTIARREGVEFETDDNRANLIAKIVANRAAGVTGTE